jgi:anaerobic dimethyl sulfoxide reductase subunit B (iron-sulfur subunit)
MGKLGFYFDSDMCTGCHTCVIACKDRNELGVGENFRKVYSYETGEYPQPSLYHLSMACYHCAEPACVRSCPTGAMFVCEDGTVQHDDSMCIFCKTCVESCPYGAPTPIEALEVVRKCDSCKPLRDAGMNPVCVDACPQRALEFGDLDELKKMHEQEELVNKLACMPEPDTAPSLLIHAKACAMDPDYEKILL